MRRPFHVGCLRGLVAVLASAAPLGAAHCGGAETTTTGTAIPHDDAGAAGAGGSGAGGSIGVGGAAAGGCPGGAGPDHRPSPASCPSTMVGGLGDAGVCVGSNECQDAGYPERFCLAGHCGPDECLGDIDCATGFACGCAGQFRGNGLHGNVCVPATCRADAECGPAGVCSPATDDSGCGSLVAFRCRSAADTCQSDADCCGDPATPHCRYSSEVGHWTCHAPVVCNG